MAKGTPRDPAETTASRVADALRHVSVDQADTSATSEVARLEQERQDQERQDQETTANPIQTGDPLAAAEQSAQESLQASLYSKASEASSGSASSGGAGGGSNEVGKQAGGDLQDLRDHLTGTDDGSGADQSSDPALHPRDALAGLADRFGSPFDRLDDPTSKQADDPNPYATHATDKSAVEDGGLEKSANVLHDQGINPSPTVSGNPTTPIGDAARQSHLEDDLASGRATQKTSSDGTVTVIKDAGTVTVVDRNNNTTTTQKPDGSTVTQNTTTGQVTDTTTPSTKTPDQDHETVLPKNFDRSQFDADGHIEREQQLRHQHDPHNVDPTGDDTTTGVVSRSGAVPDAKTHLLVGPGHDPNSPDFGGGAGTLPSPGPLSSDPNHGQATDPSEQADTGPPQLTGRDEPTHHNPTPSVEAGSARTHAGSSQHTDPHDGADGGVHHSLGGPVLSNPSIPHVEVPDHTSTPSQESPVVKGPHHAAADPAVPEAHHPGPPPPAASGEVAHDPVGQHPILPDPSAPEAHHVIQPPAAASGAVSHDPVVQHPIIEHPIIPEPAVPEAHHPEAPPAEGGDANLDPGTHHPIPEPEAHHVEFHFPG